MLGGCYDGYFKDKVIFICSMDKLLKASPEKEYLDLIISFEGGNGEEVPGPPVRYYFK